MDTRAYYNEIDPYAAEWLRNLMKEGLIPDGEVDTRSISDVAPNDLAGFTQCHFFAGVAGWSLALRLAGWADDRPVWTGSCPCQPFSVAGKGKGIEDERHLWPVFFNLIRECRPPVVMGEQVAGKAGYGWLDGVRADLEGEGYASRAVDIPACAVDAPHIRSRLYWVAVQNVDDTAQVGRQLIAGERPSCLRAERAGEAKRGGEPSDRGGGVLWGSGDMADAECDGRQGSGAVGKPVRPAPGSDGQADRPVDAGAGFWSDHEWRTGADGKARRVKSGVRLLVDGVPARASKLRAYGNAIVPQVAAEVIKAFINV